MLFIGIIFGQITSPVFGQTVPLSCIKVDTYPCVLDEDYIVEEFVIGLSFPTAMTFLGDDILVLEKNGTVRHATYNGQLVREPVLSLDVYSHVEAGLLGIESIDSDVYLSFTASVEGDASSPESYVIYRYSWDGTKLLSPQLIKILKHPLTEWGSHMGGAMATGLDKELYFVDGDFGPSPYRNMTQSLDYSDGIFNSTSNVVEVDPKKYLENGDFTYGTILKILPNEELHSVGIRNSFGLAVDPLTGNLWESENGTMDYDEINLMPDHSDSGWPPFMGPQMIYPSIPLEPISDFVYSDPEFSWEKPVAPTGLSFVEDSFKKYENWLFVSDCNYGNLYKFQLNEKRDGFIFKSSEFIDFVQNIDDSNEEILFGTKFGCITDIEFHSDGLYVVSITEGKIYKISPAHPDSPSTQIKNGVSKNKILCSFGLVPIERLSNGLIYCVKPFSVHPLVEHGWGDVSGELPHINLQNQDLKYINLQNMTLIGANLLGTDLSCADLSGANLYGAKVSGSHLTGVNFTGTNLTDVVKLSEAKPDGIGLHIQERFLSMDLVTDDSHIVAYACIE